MATILPDPLNAPFVCESCGVGFIPARRTGRFCSRACAASKLSKDWLASDGAPKPGRKYGEWTVLAYSHSARSSVRTRHFFHCRCSCGFEKPVLCDTLQKGSSLRCRACGNKTNRTTTHGATRGGKGTPEFKAWEGMRQRCSNPHNASWDYYGGRGIRVCDRWGKFENFLADMGFKPSPEYSLERVDSDKNYSPDNCRWATAKEQTNNRRQNRFLTFNDRTQTLSQWAADIGIHQDALCKRIKNGWSVERALTEPIQPRKKP